MVGVVNGVICLGILFIMCFKVGMYMLFICVEFRKMWMGILI